MGKNKRLKTTSKKIKGGPKRLSRPSGISKFNTPKPPSPQTNPNSQSPKTKTQQHTTPIIPFTPNDNILLIGDGDLSFARSLITHHHIQNLTATVYESSRTVLVEKYPHAEENIAVIDAGGGIVKYGVDAMKMKPWVKGKGVGGEGVMDRIIFNFPHVGGKSTDVNRQVRYNQELLVSFFRTSLPSLSPRHGSSIIVTLFEGEPYTLWNIRDLARHAGLEVERSFAFQAKAYPGYRHARTLGVVKGGGGWKGEERRARSYCFVRKGEGEVQGKGKGKRKRGVSESESEEESGDEEVGWGDGGEGMDEMENDDGSNVDEATDGDQSSNED